MQGSTKQLTRGLSGGHGGGGHSLPRTQVLVVSSMTLPLGHSQRATHGLVHMGLGVVQFGGQADPHLVKTWPFTGQAAITIATYVS